MCKSEGTGEISGCGVEVGGGGGAECGNGGVSVWPGLGLRMSGAVLGEAHLLLPEALGSFIPSVKNWDFLAP